MKSVLAYCLLLAAALAANSQTTPPAQKTGDQHSTSAPPAKKPENAFQRWFDFDTINLQTRYRHITPNNGLNVTNQNQWQVLVKGHFQFDAKAKYRVLWTVNTGNSFTTGWNNTGWGTGVHQTNLYVKHLFFDAKPTKKLEFQVGSFDFNRGESTEAISYDNDGYMTGERIIVRAPKTLYFDEVSATTGFLGDINHPSVFYRFKRHFDNFNYHQLLVRKQVTKQVGFSIDYTFQDGRDTLHNALRIRDPKHLYFDTVLFEAYGRFDPQRDAGMNAAAEKVVNKHFTYNFGFARIDRRLTLNGDRFQPGKRLYVTSVIKVSPVFSINPVLIHAVGELPTPTTHRTRFDLIFTYNLLEDLRRHHIL